MKALILFFAAAPLLAAKSVRISYEYLQEGRTEKAIVRYGDRVIRTTIYNPDTREETVEHFSEDGKVLREHRIYLDDSRSLMRTGRHERNSIVQDSECILKDARTAVCTDTTFDAFSAKKEISFQTKRFFTLCQPESGSKPVWTEIESKEYRRPNLHLIASVARKTYDNECRLVRADFSNGEKYQITYDAAGIETSYTLFNREGRATVVHSYHPDTRKFSKHVFLFGKWTMEDGVYLDDTKTLILKSHRSPQEDPVDKECKLQNKTTAQCSERGKDYFRTIEHIFCTPRSTKRAGSWLERVSRSYRDRDGKQLERTTEYKYDEECREKEVLITE